MAISTRVALMSFLRDAAGESTASFIDGVSGQGHQMNISQINRLLEHVRADGAQTRIEVDVLNNVTSVEDARGNITRTFRDDFGQNAILINADTGVQIQRHDAAGNSDTAAGCTRQNQSV